VLSVRRNMHVRGIVEAADSGRIALKTERADMVTGTDTVIGKAFVLIFDSVRKV
jgi:hypothetical protein